MRGEKCKDKNDKKKEESGNKKERENVKWWQIQKVGEQEDINMEERKLELQITEREREKAECIMKIADITKDIFLNKKKIKLNV